MPDAAMTITTAMLAIARLRARRPLSWPGFATARRFSPGVFLCERADRAVRNRSPASPARGDGVARDRFDNSFMRRASRPCRRHVDAAEGGAAEAVGPIHVLRRGGWMHVASRRDGAHDIGDREEGRLAARAVEGRD